MFLTSFGEWLVIFSLLTNVLLLSYVWNSKIVEKLRTKLASNLKPDEFEETKRNLEKAESSGLSLFLSTMAACFGIIVSSFGLVLGIPL